MGNRVWVADRRRGVVVGYESGYERPTARFAYPRARASGPAGLNVRESVSVASDGGAVWVTDGSQRLTRIDARSGAVAQFPAGRALDGVVSGAGAVWAFSSKTATVVRIDPRTGAITDPIQIATRRGSDKPYPVGIATTPGTVWVLNGNTATVTRIDAAQGGIRDTVAIGMDRLPRGIGASGADGLGRELRRIGVTDRAGTRHAVLDLDRGVARRRGGGRRPRVGDDDRARPATAGRQRMRRATAIASLACAAALAGACGDSGTHQPTPRAARPVSTSICGPVTYGGEGRPSG